MDDFVTYEISQKLKEKGFNEPCYGYYHLNGGDDSFEFCGNDSFDFLNSLNRFRIAAPFISQVLKWLREETKINVNMRLYKENGWYYTIQNYKGEPLYSQLTNTDELYPSYEEAVLAGIEYVLNNLI